MFKVPNNTTKNTEEYIPDRGVIPFAPELIPFILKGKKLTTYRYGLKYDYLKQGNEFNVQDSSSKEMLARGKIIAKRKLTFTELPLKLDEHETYRNKEHQRRVLSGYYAYLNREIQDTDLFLKIDFKLVGK